MGYHRAIAGAIVDPETGCYAVLRKSTPDPTLRVARIYADSALVFTRDAERTSEGGVERTVVYTGANLVSLHAVRRVRGVGGWGGLGWGEAGECKGEVTLCRVWFTGWGGLVGWAKRGKPRMAL